LGWGAQIRPCWDYKEHAQYAARHRRSEKLGPHNKRWDVAHCTCGTSDKFE